MSATPNNAAPGWDNARPLQPAAVRDTGESDGHNALQGLLAFACIHQQAARRKREAQGPTDSPLRLSREEELALDEILQLVAVRAIAITGADGVAIALAKDRAIVCRASAGKIAPDPGVKLDPESGFSGACLRSGEIVRCDDSENDARVNPQACRALGTRSMIAVPLSAKKRVIGLLEAFSAETFGFNDSDVHSLNLLGELILAAIRPEEEHHLTEMAREVIPDAAVQDRPEATIPGLAAPAPTDAAREIPSAANNARPDREQSPSAPRAGQDVSVAVIPANGKPHGTEAPITGIWSAAQAGPTAVPSQVLWDEKVTPPAPEVSSSLLETVVRSSTAEKKINGEKPSLLSGTALRSTVAVAPATPVAVAEAASAGRIEAEGAQAALPSQAPAKERRPILSVVVTAAAAMIAIGLAGALIWKAQHLGQPISASTESTSQVRAEENLPAAVPATPAPPLKIGDTALVTGIRHFSAPDRSTVVIDLEDQVQYEEHTLDNPPRVYFDLHDTKLSPTLANQTISADDAFLKRVRVAQPVDGITRVVLETKGKPDASVPSVSLDNNPYRLTIEFHEPTSPSLTSPATSPAPSPLEKPSPAVSVSPNKPRTSSQAQPNGGGFEIVLDAGHGGWDLGAVGRKGLLEKELVFDVVHRLGNLLEKRLGANVIYTRQDDSFLSLEKRAEIANLARADLFLSVHANYSDLATARGVETYYTNTYSSVKARTPDTASLQQVDWSGVVDIRRKVKGARSFASDIQQSLYTGLAARNPGVRNRGVKEAEYVVLTGTQMPAVLAEISYVSSPADEDRLQGSEYRQVIAEALYKGIVRYREEAQRKVANLQKIAQ